LPLSYAGIAILATTLIGAVMLLMIGNYYRQLEKEYLNTNALGIADSLTQMAKNDDPANPTSSDFYTQLYRDEARVTAFLIQARVQILGSDGTLLADSGRPTKAWYITLLNSSTEKVVNPGDQDSTTQAPLTFSPDTSAPKPRIGEENPSASFQAKSNMFGFLLQDTTFVEGIRSSLTSDAVFYDSEGNILGSVNLSEGPDYGHSILLSVVKGWGIASLIALAVSIALGWKMSRRITDPIISLEKVAMEMKEGNFDIRAKISKPDELASLSDTFNQMAVRIQKNINTLKQFVSDAAHEIRTPLTALRADLNLALTEKDTGKSRELVSRSLEQVNRLEQLSRELLDLSKIESQKEEIAPTLINLNELIMKTSEIHASVAEQAGIDFQVLLMDRPQVVLGHENQLHRAISNLLDNAVKFTQSGGHVRLSLQAEGPWAMIFIEDDGIGIPCEEERFLFSCFHRGRNAGNYPGSGLGLTISKAIVVNHGGDIGLLPDKDKTVFFIKIPLADPVHIS
jgi:signal transduction histidine kinase